MIKKRIKLQLKKAVSMFMGAALPGIMCTALLTASLTGCGSVLTKPEQDQTGESMQKEQVKESGDTASDNHEENPQIDFPPVIWNRSLPSDVELPSSYDYREHGRAPKIGNQGSLGTCWAFASLTALESTLLPDQTETFSVDHMSMHNHFLLGQDEGENIPCPWLISFLGKDLCGSQKIRMVTAFLPTV